MDNHYKFSKYTPLYRKQVITLLNKEWNYPENYFKWKFEDNPYSPEVVCYIILYKGVVIGFRGFIRINFKINNNTIPMLHLADGYIDINHRRKGLFLKLNKFAIKDIINNTKIILLISLSSNNYSTPSYLKQGWVPIANKEMLIYKNYFGLTYNKGGNNKIINKISIIFNKIIYFFHKNITSEMLGMNEYKVIITKRIFSKDLSEINKRLLKRNRIYNYKNESYYKWRLSNPNSKYLMCYLYSSNSILTAYVIFRKIGNEYQVIDYCYSKLIELKLIFQYFNKIKQQSFIRIPTYGKTSSELLDLKELGFISANKIGKFFPKIHIKSQTKLPYIIFATSSLDNQYMINEIDIKNNNNWNLFLIDDDGI